MFFFKQKTAYEMRISDWSSDVCSSDLIARAETLTIRNSDFISAVRLQGAGRLRIIWSHIMPLCTSSIIVRVTLDMAGIILIAAGLGFPGLGAQPPLPEWGAMLSSGRTVLINQIGRAHVCTPVTNAHL